MTPPLSAPSSAKVKSPTPMIAQYMRVKESHPDALLFYRMGDFYEMFFEDAEVGAAALGITLTKRGKSDGDDIPMCGVPVHSVDGYLARLIGAGHRVAICEQVEDPAAQKQRGGKGPLRREVIRVLTPGTLTEDDLLPPRAHNFLAALGRSGEAMALSWADMSTGDFAVQEVAPERLESLLAMLAPAELVVPVGAALPDGAAALGTCLTEQAPSLFDSVAGNRALCAYYGVASLDGFGQFSRAMTGAAGALLGYIELTQKGNMPRLRPPAAIAETGYMEIDQATRRSLEITRTLGGEMRGSLLAAIDLTVTAAGGRLLAARISRAACRTPGDHAAARAGRLVPRPSRSVRRASRHDEGAARHRPCAVAPVDGPWRPARPAGAVDGAVDGGGTCRHRDTRAGARRALPSFRRFTT